MNHGFWVFLRTPMGSWAVSYAVPGLSKRPPKPASVVAPPTYSPPHLPILAPIAPQCQPGSNAPVSSLLLLEACSLPRGQPQGGRALTGVIHCCTPRRGPGQ